VLTICCTRKLLKRLAEEGPFCRVPPSSRLGDWYANIIFTKHAKLIICVSEWSLLPVLIEAKDPTSFIPRFQGAVCSVLRRIGAASDSVNDEAREMNQIAIGPTASRRVLGSLNDLASLARFEIAANPAIDLETLAVKLADTPCSPLQYETPRSVSLALLRRVYS